jgi:hypothetical protein
MRIFVVVFNGLDLFSFSIFHEKFIIRSGPFKEQENLSQLKNIMIDRKKRATQAFSRTAHSI